MDDWEIVLAQARKYLDLDIEWTSLEERVKYRFKEIHNNKIVIERMSGGSPAIITQKSVVEAVNHLKKIKTISKRDFIKNVVRQTTLVFLHPNISYDKSCKMIYWSERFDALEEFQEYIKEVKDDELNKIQVWINQRQNQSKFKLSLLKKYNSQCLISKIKIPELIEAAHIYPHSESGQNNIANGILLRTDLHILFDRGLLYIDPENFNVIIDKSLEKTEYQKFHDLKVDLIEESKEFLLLKNSYYSNGKK